MDLVSYALFGLVIVISPGADFVLVFKNSVGIGRRAGMLTGVGIGLGVCVHITYSILGISHLISHNDMLLTSVKYAGAAYLIYLGISGILNARLSFEQDVIQGEEGSSKRYLMQGFFCNLLNPKTMLFFLSIFSQLICAQSNGTDRFVLMYGLYIALLHISWFCLLAFITTSSKATNILQRFSYRINQVCGVGLVTFGVMLV